VITKTVSEFVALLKDNDSEVRSSAAKALSAIGVEAKAAMSALSDALRDQDAEVRWSAAVALGRIGEQAKGAVPALIAALKDGESVQVGKGEWAPVCSGAYQALQMIDPEVARKANVP
jgi:HEAT repeat protein